MSKFFEKNVTKGVVLGFAGLSFVVFLVCFMPFQSGICSQFRPDCIETYFRHSLIIFWAPVLLFFSLATYKLAQTVFVAWITFAIPWIILSSLITYFLPDSLGSNPYAHWQQIASLFLSTIFLLISILIILIKSIQVYRKKK
jgi:hypothetical protein